MPGLGCVDPPAAPAHERPRRRVDPSEVRSLPITVWGLQATKEPELHHRLVEAGLVHGTAWPWSLDLEFFRSTVPQQRDRVFVVADRAVPDLAAGDVDVSFFRFHAVPPLGAPLARPGPLVAKTSSFVRYLR